MVGPFLTMVMIYSWQIAKSQAPDLTGFQWLKLYTRTWSYIDNYDFTQIIVPSKSLLLAAVEIFIMVGKKVLNILCI